MPQMKRPELKQGLGSLILMLITACSMSDPPAVSRDNSAPPVVAGLHRDHGWAALRAERNKEAASYFQRVLKALPDDENARLGLGEAYLGQGRLEEARSQFEGIDDQAKAAMRAKALQGKGLVFLKQGDRDEALRFLKAAAKLDAGLWRSWNALGRLYDADQNFSDARRAYRKAIELNPKAAILHNNLGFSLLVSGEPVYAEEALNRALVLDPKLDAAATNLRLALALQGRYEPALAGAGQKNRATVMNNVGYAALLRGDHQKAKSLFQSAMAADPGFFDEARRNLAFVEALKNKKFMER